MIRVAASFERNISIIGTGTDGEAAATVSQSFQQSQGGKKKRKKKRLLYYEDANIYEKHLFNKIEAKIKR